MTSAIAFLTTAVGAHCLPPETMGVFQTLALVQTYCSFLHLGVFNGLNRNIALYNGQGRNGESLAIVSSSWFVAKVVSFVGGVISVAILGFLISREVPATYFWGMIFVTVSLVIEPFSTHLDAVFLSSNTIGGLGKRLVVQNLAGAVACILPYWFGVIGFAICRVVQLVARLLVRLVRVPIEPTTTWRTSDIVTLSKVGMPLLIAGTLNAFLNVADRSVVAFRFTPRDVGAFSLAGMISMGLQFMPLFVATVYYPRITAEYGRTGRANSLRRFCWRMLWVGIIAVWVPAVFCFLLIRPITVAFFPQYFDGVRPAEIACLAAIPTVHIGVASILAALRRNTLYIIGIGIAIVIVWLGGLVAVKYGFGLAGVVWVRGGANLVLCCVTLAYAFFVTRETKAGD